MANKATMAAKMKSLSNKTSGRDETRTRAKFSVTIPAELEWAMQRVLWDHRQWMDENPESTLGELRERIDEAVEPCSEIADCEGDPHIHENNDIPEPLIYELDEWGNANLEDFQWALEPLEEMFGPEFVVSEFRRVNLPKQRRRKTA